MNGVEIIPGIDLSLNLVMTWLIRVLMILITVLSLIVMRQVKLMDKVVNVPVGGNFKLLSRLFFWVCLILTGIVILVG